MTFLVSGERLIIGERRMALTMIDVLTGLRGMALTVNGLLTVRGEWS